jgi:hypothetical protein
MLRMLGKVALASLVLIGLCGASSHWLLSDWEIQSFVTKLAALLGTVVLGAAAFVACGLVLRIEELTELLDALRRRTKRSR